MREIKFRCWEKYGSGFRKIESNYDLKYWQSDGSQGPENPLTEFNWEQFTGLKDKNNVEIYEGDIIQGMSWSTAPGRKGPVYFEHGCFQWLGEPIAYDIEEQVLMHSEKWATVIGNIHQNADLL